MISNEQKLYQRLRTGSKAQHGARVPPVSPRGILSKLAWLAAWLAVSLASSAEALDLNKFQELVIFGDSLSDNGNSFFLFQQPPDPPYYHGRWTNGRNWVDYFPSIAHHFAPVTAFFANPNCGTNVAVGGSTSVLAASPGVSPTPLLFQISTFLLRHGGRASADHLFLIWIGSNDFNAGIDPSVTVSAIKDGIVQLWPAGAEAVVLLELPDISLTPAVIAQGTVRVQQAKSFVTTVNNGLQAQALPLAAVLRIRLVQIDVNVLFKQLVCTPGMFGFTNSSGYALDPSTGGGDTDPNDYVFWDGFHPTTRAHEIAAEYFYETIVSSAASPAVRLIPLAR